MNYGNKLFVNPHGTCGILFGKLQAICFSSGLLFSGAYTSV
jgi:hypothetical protein